MGALEFENEFLITPNFELRTLFSYQTMQVNVKFFSYLRQITGTDQLSVDLAEKATVADLLKSLNEKFDGLSIKDERTSIMVNHKNVFPHTILKEGDQVLLLPIMEGG